jgi:hypothetical protein
MLVCGHHLTVCASTGELHSNEMIGRPFACVLVLTLFYKEH